MRNEAIISQEMLEFRPILSDNAISYIRDEKDGWKSVAFNSPVNFRPMLLSKVDIEFMELCDGEHTVNEIIEIISSRNKDIPWIINMINSNKLVAVLNELMVISGKNSNLFSYSLELEDGSEIAELPYMERTESSKNFKKVFLDIEKYHIYVNPIFNDELFTGEEYRRKFMNLDNRIFVVRKKTQIVLVLMLKKGDLDNEYILDNLICHKAELASIRLKGFNKLLNSDNVRIKIHTFNRDDMLFKLFDTDNIEEFILKKELDAGTDVIESDMYYFELC